MGIILDRRRYPIVVALFSDRLICVLRNEPESWRASPVPIAIVTFNVSQRKYMLPGDVSDS